MAANGLSCIPLTAGYHTVAMTFIPPSFKTGLIISVLSLVILIVLFVINRKKHKGRKEFDPVYIDVMGLAREATDLPKRLRANEQDGVEAGVAAPQLFPNIEQQSDIGQQTDESQIDDGQLTTETDLAAWMQAKQAVNLQQVTSRKVIARYLLNLLNYHPLISVHGRTVGKETK